MDMPAGMAGFGAWIESIHYTKFYANAFSLSLQLSQQAMKSLCRHSLCQMPVLYHALCSFKGAKAFT